MNNLFIYFRNQLYRKLTRETYFRLNMNKNADICDIIKKL